MNIELNQAFYEYMEEFKKLDINDKKVEIINSLKETNALIDYLAEREQKQLQHIKSKEIAELNNGLENENDFLEALLVYSENAKNLLGQYLNDKIWVWIEICVNDIYSWFRKL